MTINLQSKIGIILILIYYKFVDNLMFFLKKLTNKCNLNCFIAFFIF